MIQRIPLLIRWILFIGAYYPLFLIIAIKNTKLNILSFKNIFPMLLTDILFYVVILGIFIISLMCYYLFCKNKTNTKEFEVIECQDISYETLNYIFTYIIAFFSVDLKDVRNIVCILILVFIIGIIYINSNLFYINPMLNIFGYSIYKLKVKNSSSDKEERIITIIKNGKIKTGEYLNSSLLNENVYNFYLSK